MGLWERVRSFQIPLLLTKRRLNKAFAEKTEIVFAPKDLIKYGINGKLKMTEVFPDKDSDTLRLKGQTIDLKTYQYISFLGVLSIILI